MNVRTTEPVRVGGWTSLIVGAILQAIILFTTGTPPLAIIGSIALLLLTSGIGGLEWARNRTVPVVRHLEASPDTVAVVDED